MLMLCYHTPHLKGDLTRYLYSFRNMNEWLFFIIFEYVFVVFLKVSLRKTLSKT